MVRIQEEELRAAIEARIAKLQKLLYAPFQTPETFQMMLDQIVALKRSLKCDLVPGDTAMPQRSISARHDSQVDVGTGAGGN